uniref:Uncharacterized protein n=1 Tax=Caenorhabditis tropicalis TaxID=1561998 RepID=A0A1I7TL34_9PELO
MGPVGIEPGRLEPDRLKNEALTDCAMRLHLVRRPLGIYELNAVFIGTTCSILTISIYLLIVGIVEKDSCPIDTRIPPWLISTAALMIIERLMEAMNQAMILRFVNSNPKPSSRDEIKDWEEERAASQSKALWAVTSLFRLGIFVSTIVGSVFVFSAYSNHSQCNALLYWSSFVYCIVSLAMTALGLIVFGAVMCIFAVLAVKSK